jgi:hypothetical protein
MISKRVVKLIATDSSSGRRGVLEIFSRKNSAIIKFMGSIVGWVDKHELVKHIELKYKDLTPASFSREFVFPFEMKSLSCITRILFKEKNHEA